MDYNSMEGINPLEAALPPTLLGEQLAARFPTYNSEWRNHLSELFDLPLHTCVSRVWVWAQVWVHTFSFCLLAHALVVHNVSFSMTLYWLRFDEAV